MCAKTIVWLNWILIPSLAVVVVVRLFMTSNGNKEKQHKWISQKFDIRSSKLHTYLCCLFPANQFEFIAISIAANFYHQTIRRRYSMIECIVLRICVSSTTFFCLLSIEILNALRCPFDCQLSEMGIEKIRKRIKYIRRHSVDMFDI